MPTSSERAQELSERIYARIRRRVLQAIVAADPDIDAIFDELAKRIRQRLRTIERTDAQVAAILREEFDAAFEQRRELIEGLIHEGARHGATVDRRVFERVFGPGGPDERPFARRSASPTTAKPPVRLLRGSEDEPPETA